MSVIGFLGRAQRRLRKLMLLAYNQLKFISVLLTMSLRQSKNMLLKIAFIASIAMICNVAAIVWLNSSQYLNLPSTGTIRSLGVEAFGGDVDFRDGIVYIDWGTIYPGVSKTNSFYLQSTSDVDVTVYIDTTNWSPDHIASFMNLSWNYSGKSIAPGETIPVTLNLFVSSSSDFIDYVMANDVEEFSFDIHICASES